MNDASLSQTAGRAKTRQPGLLVKPAQIVLSSYSHLLFCIHSVSIRKLFCFRMETAGFQFGNEQLFPLGRKSSNYEEAYLNTLTKYL